MSLAAARRPPPPIAFETAWLRNARLLAAVGFFAIAYTGELNPIAIFLFIAAWLGAWFLEPPAFWRPWMGSAVLVAASCGIVLIALRETFTSVLYLLTLLAATKCFALPEPRDHLHMIVVTFLMLLACSVIMVSALFIAFMLLYLSLLIPEMMMLAQARDAAAVEKQAWRTRPAPQRLIRRGFYSALLALGITVCIFLIVPHTAERGFRPGNWQSALAEAQATSGFTGELDVRAIESIAPDDTVAMTVYAHWDRGVSRPLPVSLRMRGAILDSFNDGRWTRNFGRGNVPIEDQHQVVVRDPRPGEAVLVQQVDLDVSSGRQLFAQPEVLRYYFPGYAPDMRVDTQTGLLWLTSLANFANQESKRLEYTVYSAPAVELFDGAANAGEDAQAPSAQVPELSPWDRNRNLELPRNRWMPKVREIARDVVGAIDDPEEKVKKLVQWFDAEFAYTLSPQSPRGMNPVEGFLTVTRKGHCELFATSLALMLRSQGVPVRIVTGYYPNQTNNGLNTYTVRRSDAHAWTEVWLEGRGWTVVDPTPPEHRGRASYGNNLEIFWVRQVSAVRTFWRKFVLNYNQATQGEMLKQLLEMPLVKSMIAVDWTGESGLIARVRAMFDLSEAMGEWGARHGVAADLISAFLAPSIAIAALAAGWSLMRLRQRRRFAARLERSRVAFMNVMLARLKRQGIARAQSQTPGELLAVAGKTMSNERVGWLMELYQRMRFGNYRPTRRELLEALRVVRELA